MFKENDLITAEVHCIQIIQKNDFLNLLSSYKSVE